MRRCNQLQRFSIQQRLIFSFFLQKGKFDYPIRIAKIITRERFSLLNFFPKFHFITFRTLSCHNDIFAEKGFDYISYDFSPVHCLKGLHQNFGIAPCFVNRGNCLVEIEKGVNGCLCCPNRVFYGKYAIVGDLTELTDEGEVR